jgi:hypothetical protein
LVAAELAGLVTYARHAGDRCGRRKISMEERAMLGVADFNDAAVDRCGFPDLNTKFKGEAGEGVESWEWSLGHRVVWTGCM